MLSPLVAPPVETSADVNFPSLTVEERKAGHRLRKVQRITEGVQHLAKGPSSKHHNTRIL